MKNNMKKMFLGIAMAAVVMVTAAGVSAEAAFELCTHYWTVDEYVETKELRYSHSMNELENCTITEVVKVYNVRCRSCGEITRQRTETISIEHSIKH